ncbi:class I SAM-dependent methyltransferase [Shimia ponticola]|uniref:class I SAM-dependent methyltransferase n=1 Tax=Shimia ponticola TaxID=2582893 RepID=UPI0011BDE469|nr:class I SAM-dependent methyltransferase [Shimia ponticola]
MPTPQRFWDRNAAKYAKSKIGDMPAYEITLERIRSYLSPEQSMLEFGCGTGSTALLLASQVREIIGTDISGEMVRIAMEKATAQGISNVTFRQATATATQPEGPFDVVFGSSILHLIEGLPETLIQLKDHVKPGGLFITKTPCLGEAGVFIRMVIPVMQCVGIAPYVNSLSILDVDAAIEKAGFEIVETGQFQKGMPSRFVVARRPADS